MEERKTIVFRLGCLGLFLLFYVAPGLLASIFGEGPAGTKLLGGLFYIVIALMVGLWFTVPTQKQNTPIVRRLKYFSVMGVLLSFTALLLWIGTGRAGGTFSFEFGAGMGAGASEGGVTFEGPLNKILGQVIFGGLGLVLGSVTLYFGIPYGKRLLKETSTK